MLLTACATNPATIDPDMLARKFGEVAFGDDFRGQSDRHRLAKWTHGFEVEVHGGSDRMRRLLDQHLATLRALTGLPVVRAQGGGSMVVHFVPRDEFEALAARVDGDGTWTADLDCAATFAFGTDGYIVGSLILIATDIAGRRAESCLPEEIFQSLGLARDTNVPPRPSIVSERDLLMALSPYDEMMVRALYDSRVRPGMTKAEALPVVRLIFDEYLAELH